MDGSMKDLDALFADVRRTQDAMLREDAGAIDDLAARMRAHLEAEPAAEEEPAPAKPVARTWPRMLAWAAAALLALGGGAAALQRALTPDAIEPPLSWRVDAPSAQTYEGWVATGASPGRVSFSDGSQLALAEATRLRVLDVRADGATLVLEEGRVESRIHHRDEPTWRLHAGPFVVHVRGTTFVTRWDPATGTLGLELVEGRVELGGACLDRTRRVSTGESIELRCPLPVAVAEVIEPVVEAQVTPPIELPSEAPNPPSAVVRRAREPRVEPPIAAPAPSPREDLRLAQAAASAGDTSEAMSRYRALRDAHAGTDEAALAAFLLGRLAFDEQRDRAAAATWFRQYLGERPHGSLAREARGRLMEALDALGRHDEAEREARAYLELHPGGPHAELARRLAGP